MRTLVRKKLRKLSINLGHGTQPQNHWQFLKRQKIGLVKQGPGMLWATRYNGTFKWRVSIHQNRLNIPSTCTYWTYQNRLYNSMNVVCAGTLGKMTRNDWNILHLPRPCFIAPPKNTPYSGDLNNELVRYSNGSKLFDQWMVPYSDHHLNNELKVRYSGHGLNSELKVRYSNGCISLDRFIFKQNNYLNINGLC